jgi:ABC-type sugar transport system ATPase subunit
MVMLTFTVDKNNKLLKVEKSKEKGLFESKSDKKYAKKIINKLKERTNNGKKNIKSKSNR